MKRNYDVEKKECKTGDVVRCAGREYVIGKILYQFYSERGVDDDGWMIEFIDTRGDYHYWKQYLDGGELLQKIEKGGER